MSDEIGFGAIRGEPSDPSPPRRLTPMRVGEATVYVEQVGETLYLEGSDEIYPATSGTERAFEEASRILKECVRVVGDQVADLGQRAKPRQVSVEFALSFEAKGRAQIIPVLFTGETKATSGLKVTAVWGDLAGG